MGLVVAGILILGLGLLYAVKPKAGAYMLWWSELRGPEEHCKVMRIGSRIVGICLVIVGLLILFVVLMAYLEEIGVV